jgi:hypothetical protein
MDQRERYPDEAEYLRLAMEAWQTKMWTAMPGVIVNFPSASGIGKMVADIQPTINGRIRTTEGEFQSIQMPVLLDCPVVFPGGGGVILTFPLKPGDECLVVFASRCIDAWWKQGFVSGQAGVPVDGKQAMDPPDLRMHNLSDGFAFVGVRSSPKEITPDTGNAQLRTDDKAAGFSVASDGSHNLFVSTTDGDITIDSSSGNVNVTSGSGQITATAPTINLNGVTIDSSGNITTSGDVISKGTVLHTHIHTGGTISGDTGPPV